MKMKQIRTMFTISMSLLLIVAGTSYSENLYRTEGDDVLINEEEGPFISTLLDPVENTPVQWNFQHNSPYQNSVGSKPVTGLPAPAPAFAPRPSAVPLNTKPRPNDRASAAQSIIAATVYQLKSAIELVHIRHASIVNFLRCSVPDIPDTCSQYEPKPFVWNWNLFIPPGFTVDSFFELQAPEQLTAIFSVFRDVLEHLHDLQKSTVGFIFCSCRKNTTCAAQPDLQNLFSGNILQTIFGSQIPTSGQSAFKPPGSIFGGGSKPNAPVPFNQGNITGVSFTGTTDGGDGSTSGGYTGAVFGGPNSGGTFSSFSSGNRPISEYWLGGIGSNRPQGGSSGFFGGNRPQGTIGSSFGGGSISPTGSSSTGSGLSGAGLSGSGITGSGLSGTGLSGAGLSGTGLSGSGLSTSSSSGAGLSGSGITGSGTGTGLSGAGLTGTGLSGAGLSSSGLTGTGLSGTGLSGAGLSGTGLSGSGLSTSSSSGAGLTGSGLSGAGSSGSGLSGFGLPGAGSSGSGLSGFGLPGAGSSGSALSGFGLPGAGLYGTGNLLGLGVDGNLFGGPSGLGAGLFGGARPQGVDGSGFGNGGASGSLFGGNRPQGLFGGLGGLGGLGGILGGGGFNGGRPQGGDIFGGGSSLGLGAGLYGGAGPSGIEAGIYGGAIPGLYGEISGGFGPRPNHHYYYHNTQNLPAGGSGLSAYGRPDSGSQGYSSVSGSSSASGSFESSSGVESGSSLGAAESGMIVPGSTDPNTETAATGESSGIGLSYNLNTNGTKTL